MLSQFMWWGPRQSQASSWGFVVVVVVVSHYYVFGCFSNFHSLLSNSKGLLKYLGEAKCKFLIHVQSTWKILGWFFFFKKFQCFFFFFPILWCCSSGDDRYFKSLFSQIWHYSKYESKKSFKPPFTLYAIVVIFCEFFSKKFNRIFFFENIFLPD